MIPDYSAVIFDEAHLIEDIASDYFGFQVSNFQIDELVRDAGQLSISDAVALNAILKSVSRVAGVAEQFWVRFTQAWGQEGRYPLLSDAFAHRDVDGSDRHNALGEAYIARRGSSAAGDGNRYLLREVARSRASFDA